MEKVHVYQTIFQSTLDTSLRGLQNSNGSAPNKHPPLLVQY